jgi:hypothetical protein
MGGHAGLMNRSRVRVGTMTVHHLPTKGPAVTVLAIEPRLTGANWRRASRSATNGQCIEVAQGGGIFGVRDSKDPTGDVLVLAPTTWALFLAVTSGTSRAGL